jgi:hypothetical protein
MRSPLRHHLGLIRPGNKAKCVALGNRDAMDQRPSFETLALLAPQDEEY